MNKGFFVTFEGPDCAGKSTQVKLLAEWMQNKGIDVVCTREPGGTQLAERIRTLLLEHATETIAPEAELLLFGASRAQHMKNLILPHLEKGGAVICDRFYDSTTAYQGYARGLNMNFIQAMHDFSISGRKPNITILLDLTLQESRRRMAARKYIAADRMEDENNDFHEKVRLGFLDLAKKEPDRIIIIDACADVQDIAEKIQGVIQNALERI